MLSGLQGLLAGLVNPPAMDGSGKLDGTHFFGGKLGSMSVISSILGQKVVIEKKLINCF
jgi:hypothetical protein